MASVGPNIRYLRETKAMSEYKMVLLSIKE